MSRSERSEKTKCSVLETGKGRLKAGEAEREE